MVFIAPAKVNLYLKVIRRRDDGYHEIETVFERISLFDRLNIRPSENGPSIACSDPAVPTGPDSLMGKTLSAFSELSGKQPAFDIYLEKKIPIGAGLGGGSSDSAALLLALNEMSGGPLSREQLKELGAGLGSDVPFFLEDCSIGIGTGRGEQVKRVEIKPELWHILVTPPFEVLSKDVYSRVSAFGLTKDRGVDRMVTAFSGPEEAKDIASDLRNDLQAIVLRDYPVLGRVISELLGAGAMGALVSGSGPTVFGVFDRENAQKAAAILEKVFPAEENWRVCVARTY